MFLKEFEFSKLNSCTPNVNVYVLLYQNCQVDLFKLYYTRVN